MPITRHQRQPIYLRFDPAKTGFSPINRLGRNSHIFAEFSYSTRKAILRAINYRIKVCPSPFERRNQARFAPPSDPLFDISVRRFPIASREKKKEKGEGRGKNERNGDGDFTVYFDWPV